MRVKNRVRISLLWGLVLGSLPLLECDMLQVNGSGLNFNASTSTSTSSSTPSTTPSTSNEGGAAPPSSQGDSSQGYSGGSPLAREKQAWKAQIAKVASAGTMDLNGELVFKLVPVPGATKYACDITQGPTASGVEWTSLCGSGPHCYPATDKPECRIAAGEAVSMFTAGPVKIAAYAGRMFRKDISTTEEAMEWTGWTRGSETEITLVVPKSGQPPTPWDAQYKPWMVNRTPDSPFVCNTGDLDSIVTVEGGQFTLFMLFVKKEGHRVPDSQEISPDSYVRVTGTIKADGKVGPTPISLTPPQLAAIGKLGWNNVSALSLRGWFKKANSAKLGQGRVGRLWIDVAGGKSGQEEGCNIFSMRSPEYQPGQEDSDMWEQLHPSGNKVGDGGSCVVGSGCESGYCNDGVCVSRENRKRYHR